MYGDAPLQGPRHQEVPITDLLKIEQKRRRYGRGGDLRPVGHTGNPSLLGAVVAAVGDQPVVAEESLDADRGAWRHPDRVTTSINGRQPDTRLVGRVEKDPRSVHIIVLEGNDG